MEMENAFKTFGWKARKGGDHSEDRSTDRRIILKWILRILGVGNSSGSVKCIIKNIYLQNWRKVFGLRQRRLLNFAYLQLESSNLSRHGSWRFYGVALIKWQSSAFIVKYLLELNNITSIRTTTLRKGGSKESKINPLKAVVMWLWEEWKPAEDKTKVNIVTFMISICC